MTSEIYADFTFNCKNYDPELNICKLRSSWSCNMPILKGCVGPCNHYRSSKISRYDKVKSLPKKAYIEFIDKIRNGKLCIDSKSLEQWFDEEYKEGDF